MEFRAWHYMIFYFVFIKYLEAKTISLNELIAAELQQKEAFETTFPPKPAVITRKRPYLIKAPRPFARIKQILDSGLSIVNKPFEGSILSPLKYKKTYLIKSPLKPKKLKLLQKSRYKHKNQSTKREINGNEKLKQKYIPLLKSLSMLFDNLLNSDASESYEVKTKKFKRHRFYSEETFEDISSAEQPKPEFSKKYSQKTTVTVTPTTTIEVSVTAETPTTAATTSTTTDNTATRDFSTIRRNKNLPVLLARDTCSGRRNDNGICEGSSATLHGNIEGNITRHYRNHEHVSRCAENDSCTEDGEKNTDRDTRDSARSSGFAGLVGNRNNTGLIQRGSGTNSENVSKIETTDDGLRENQFEIGRNETTGGRILQESLRRLRGFSEDINKTTEPVQSKEVHEENVNVTHDIASYQRVADGGGSIAKENKKIREGNERMTLIDSLNLAISSSTPKKKAPVVMIYDGYSIARHKNGENKFSEKSIRLHS
ncbi:unnamed protein product [Spodoptera littoralis]|uniref:Uncharacterized protein n=1 Tax=Spodoptera littoralis TaxID=7109 RepID=A0A9P0II32_SPOLI|nr:unnamed protein product [Spodoptera littoralis]CAH1647136.1 unnamed protein product [Spodoptera littoralis]